MNLRMILAATVAAGALTLAGCGAQQPERITGGAAAGAGTGAAIGALAGGVGVIPGALWGAGIGAGGGALTGPETVDLGPPVWR